VVVTTPEWVTSSVLLGALSHLQHDHTTGAINRSRLDSQAIGVIEDRFRAPSSIVDSRSSRGIVTARCKCSARTRSTRRDRRRAGRLRDSGSR
jgi:hypothetical protein